MMISHKVRLIPTTLQLDKLYQSSNTSRWVYNWVLSIQQTNYRLGGRFIQDGIIRKHITKMKKRPKYFWINNVSNDVAKQAVKDACKAYKNMFNGYAKQPRFKSKR